MVLRRARDILWDVAVEQYGYVTTNNVRAVGLEPVAVRQLVHRGQLEPAAHGVYRFPQFPITEFDRYMLAVLWTGKATARLSHGTALAQYDVCDINPDRIDLSLPRSARTRRQGGDLYVLHYEEVALSEQAWWQRIPTVTLSTAIRQSAVADIPNYLIRQAVENGSKKGLLLRSETDALSEAFLWRND